MIYFKNENGAVYAYTDSDLAQVDRLNALEKTLSEKEPLVIDAQNDLHHAELLHNQAIASFEFELAQMQPDEECSEEWQREHEERLQELRSIVDETTSMHEGKSLLFNQINSEYQLLKTEYDAILPVFFNIRENLKVFKKMTDKEIEAHINPPVTQEQQTSNAVQQKQSLLSEATENIAVLQDAVDLSMATDQEVALLKEWKTYRVYLNRVDTSLAPDIEWPQRPE
ncbi:tail fiber assembly protein [Moellerella wisconsensis]|uniref:tail fiber assembly protein n=1 Tax=Moellerella wisconsensis TaxID=158849 RepID=UPI003B213AED